MNMHFKKHMTAGVFVLLGSFVSAQETPVQKKPSDISPTRASSSAKKANIPGEAEARLIVIYQLIAKAETRSALTKADRLIADYPNFQLAQLVYGDLLAARVRPVKILGDVPETQVKGAESALSQLREESQLRLKALRERPDPGAVPSEFLALSSANKHAIAIDASRSRLYLFENSSTGLKLIKDFYISVGKSGLEKTSQGDSKTPLGIYFITSNLDPKSLKNFYGSGALPINYPNVLDAKRGKTGNGIWLHGTPPEQFARSPKASDGCIVLSNPDLLQISRTVEVRTTPVVISKRLNWVSQNTTQLTKKQFESSLDQWRIAKSVGNIEEVLDFYSPDFTSYGLSLPQWTPLLKKDIKKANGREIVLKDVSMLHWSDVGETMVVTFGEVSAGRLTGPMKRQYWSLQSKKWKIFFEGVI
jgi:murein L,D-transpeptidase YafK